MGQEQRVERVVPVGVGGTVTDIAGDEVRAAINLIRAEVGALSRDRFWARSDVQAREGVRESFGMVQSLEFLRLQLLADLDTRLDAVDGARAGKVGQTFVREGLHRTAGASHADMRAVRALIVDTDPAAGGLPEVAAVFAAGLISREHVDVIVRTLDKIPLGVLAADPPQGLGAVMRSSTHPDGFTCCGEGVDAFLAEQAQHHDPYVLAQLGKYLLDALDPDRSDGFDPTAYERRGLTQSTDSTGMVVGTFTLDAVGGELFTKALEHFSAPEATRIEYTDDGTAVVIRDTRTRAQRYADALVNIAKLALGADQAGTSKGGEPPRIVIHCGIDDLETTHDETEQDEAETEQDETVQPHQPDSPETSEPPKTQEPSQTTADSDSDSDSDSDDARDTNSEPIDDEPNPSGTNDTGAFGTGERMRPGARPARCGETALSTRLLNRFACDSVLQKALLAPNGAVLDLGRDTRTISRAQRRALNARDRGCAIPGCTAPPTWCEGHHVRWWRHEGPTDIDNLALVCSRHHDLIHMGVWDLTMINGIPWARPPRWIDTQRRPIRNTLHDDADHATTLGTQLRLALTPGPEPPRLTPPQPPRSPSGNDPPRSDSG